MTGTLMASPHVTGLAAHLATLYGQRASPDFCRLIQNLALRSAIRDQRVDTTNHLAFNGNTYQ